MSKERVTKYIIELHLIEVEVEVDSETEDYWEFDEIEAEIYPLGDYDDYDEAQDSFNDYKEQLV